MMKGKDRNDEYVASVLNGTKEVGHIQLHDLMLKNEKSFKQEEYWDEFVKIYPEFNEQKDFMYNEFKEENIKDTMRLYWNPRIKYVCDGDSSMREVREGLGVDVGSHFKLPNGMSPVEYERYRVCKYAVNPGIDDVKYGSKINANADIDELNDRILAGHVQAWRNLHGISQEEALGMLQEDFKKLNELNSNKLDKLNFDMNSAKDLWHVTSGVVYDFPIEDIQLFVDYKKNGTDNFATKDGKVDGNELIGDFRFSWRLSEQTLKNIEQQLLKKQNEKRAADNVENSGQSSKNVSSVETESKALSDDKPVVAKESGAGKAKENLNKELSKIVVETKTNTNTKAIQMRAMQNRGR